MGEFFQQVHVWVVKNCTPWYMDGPDLIYRGTWMGHFSFKIGTWMGDGWWHFKIPRGTPLPRPNLNTPPGSIEQRTAMLEVQGSNPWPNTFIY